MVFYVDSLVFPVLADYDIIHQKLPLLLSHRLPNASHRLSNVLFVIFRVICHRYLDNYPIFECKNTKNASYMKEIMQKVCQKHKKRGIYSKKVGKSFVGLGKMRTFERETN